jgi:hypothetical protein
MGNALSKEDDGDYLYTPDESWLEGMLEVDEGEMDNEFLQLDDCVGVCRII